MVEWVVIWFTRKMGGDDEDIFGGSGYVEGR